MKKANPNWVSAPYEATFLCVRDIEKTSKSWLDGLQKEMPDAEFEVIRHDDHKFTIKQTNFKRSAGKENRA